MILFINYTLLRITTHFYSIAITLQRYSEKEIISNRFSKYTWPWNRVVPKKTAVRTCRPIWRHVNIGTIDSGQNICSTIYNNKLEQKFCDIIISQWGLSAPTAKLDLWSSLLTFGRVGVNSTLLSLNRSLPPSVIQWYRLLWSNSRVVFISFPFQWSPWGRVEGTDKRK